MIKPMGAATANLTIKKNPVYLCLVCLVAALGGFLFGFDTAVISGTVKLVKTDFNLDSLHEGWFVSCALLGCIIGVSASGRFSDRYGRKIVMIVSAALFLISAVGCMFCDSFTQLILFRLAGGLGIGVASMVSPLYISEFSPPGLRGMMVSLYQLALTIGILTAYFSNVWLLNHVAGTFANAGTASLFVRQPWRLMLGAGSAPAIVFLLSLLFIPESPRWLLLKGYHERAATVLAKIGNRDTIENNFTDLQTKAPAQVGNLFKPAYCKVLFIGLALPFLSQVCGINAIIYYGPRILEQAGFTLNNALGGQVTIGLVNVVFTLVAIFTVDKWGRRPLLFTGIGGVVLSLLVIGALFALKVTSGIWILVFILAFIACFAFSFGPVCWVVVGEIFPNAIRARAMALATLSLWVANFIVGQLTPLMLENLGAAWTFWLFAIFCCPALWITWKLIPETKGRSLEMIEDFWNTSNTQ